MGGRALDSPVAYDIAFKSKVPRSFINLHPAYVTGGRSPNTLNIKRQVSSPSNYELSWDSRHWARPGRTSTISSFESPSALAGTGPDTPGPGFYHKRAEKDRDWEDDPAAIRAATSPPARRAR